MQSFDTLVISPLSCRICDGTLLQALRYAYSYISTMVTVVAGLLRPILLLLLLYIIVMILLLLITATPTSSTHTTISATSPIPSTIITLLYLFEDCRNIS